MPKEWATFELGNEQQNQFVQFSLSSTNMTEYPIKFFIHCSIPYGNQSQWQWMVLHAGNRQRKRIMNGWAIRLMCNSSIKNHQLSVHGFEKLLFVHRNDSAYADTQMHKPIAIAWWYNVKCSVFNV